MVTAAPAPGGRGGPGRPRKVPHVGQADPRQEIVAAASRLFARRGIAATTMAKIAEAAGLGPSSLYYWFRSKGQILEVLVTEVNRAPLQFAESMAAEGGPAAVRLYRLVHFDARTLSALPFDINEVHRLAAGDEPEFARYWADRRQLIEAVARLVGEGVASGELRPVDPRLAALTVLANDEAAQNWLRPRPAGDPPGYGADEAATFLADLTLRGLLADPARLDEVRAAAAVAVPGDRSVQDR